MSLKKRIFFVFALMVFGSALFASPDARSSSQPSVSSRVQGCVQKGVAQTTSSIMNTIKSQAESVRSSAMALNPKALGSSFYSKVASDSSAISSMATSYSTRAYSIESDARSLSTISTYPARLNDINASIKTMTDNALKVEKLDKEIAALKVKVADPKLTTAERDGISAKMRYKVSERDQLIAFIDSESSAASQELDNIKPVDATVISKLKTGIASQESEMTKMISSVTNMNSYSALLKGVTDSIASTPSLNPDIANDNLVHLERLGNIVSGKIPADFDPAKIQTAFMGSFNKGLQEFDLFIKASNALDLLTGMKDFVSFLQTGTQLMQMQGFILDIQKTATTATNVVSVFKTVLNIIGAINGGGFNINTLMDMSKIAKTYDSQKANLKSGIANIKASAGAMQSGISSAQSSMKKMTSSLTSLKSSPNIDSFLASLTKISLVQERLPELTQLQAYLNGGIFKEMFGGLQSANTSANATASVLNDPAIKKAETEVSSMFLASTQTSGVYQTVDSLLNSAGQGLLNVTSSLSKTVTDLVNEKAEVLGLFSTAGSSSAAKYSSNYSYLEKKYNARLADLKIADLKSLNTSMTNHLTTMNTIGKSSEALKSSFGSVSSKISQMKSSYDSVALTRTVVSKIDTLTSKIASASALKNAMSGKMSSLMESVRQCIMVQPDQIMRGLTGTASEFVTQKVTDELMGYYAQATNSIPFIVFPDKFSSSFEDFKTKTSNASTPMTATEIAAEAKVLVKTYDDKFSLSPSEMRQLEAETLKNQITVMEQEIANLKLKISEQERILASMSYSQSRYTIRETRMQLNILAARVKFMNQTQKDNLASLESKKKLLIQATADVTTLTSEVQGLDSQISALKSDIASIKLQISDKEKLLATASTADAVDLNNQISALKADLSSKDATLQSTTYTRSSKQNMLSSALSQKASLTVEVQDLENTVATMERNIKSVENYIAEQDEFIKTGVPITRTELRNQINAAKSELRDTENTLAKTRLVYNSKQTASVSGYLRDKLISSFDRVEHSGDEFKPLVQVAALSYSYYPKWIPSPVSTTSVPKTPSVTATLLPKRKFNERQKTSDTLSAFSADYFGIPTPVLEVPYGIGFQMKLGDFKATLHSPYKYECGGSAAATLGVNKSFSDSIGAFFNEEYDCLYERKVSFRCGFLKCYEYVYTYLPGCDVTMEYKEPVAQVEVMGRTSQAHMSSSMVLGPLNDVSRYLSIDNMLDRGTSLKSGYGLGTGVDTMGFKSTAYQARVYGLSPTARILSDINPLLAPYTMACDLASRYDKWEYLAFPGIPTPMLKLFMSLATTDNPVFKIKDWYKTWYSEKAPQVGLFPTPLNLLYSSEMNKSEWNPYPLTGGGEFLKSPLGEKKSVVKDREELLKHVFSHVDETAPDAIYGVVKGYCERVGKLGSNANNKCIGELGALYPRNGLFYQHDPHQPLREMMLVGQRAMDRSIEDGMYKKYMMQKGVEAHGVNYDKLEYSLEWPFKTGRLNVGTYPVVEALKWYESQKDELFSEGLIMSYWKDSKCCLRACCEIPPYAPGWNHVQKRREYYTGFVYLNEKMSPFNEPDDWAIIKFRRDY